MKNIQQLAMSFGQIETKSKSGTCYLDIKGHEVRVSDHYVSKCSGGLKASSDIEVIGKWSMYSNDGTREFYGVSITLNRYSSSMSAEKWYNLRDELYELEEAYDTDEIPVEIAIEFINKLY